MYSQPLKAKCKSKEILFGQISAIRARKGQTLLQISEFSRGTDCRDVATGQECFRLPEKSGGVYRIKGTSGVTNPCVRHFNTWMQWGACAFTR